MINAVLRISNLEPVISYSIEPIRNTFLIPILPPIIPITIN